jgi:hypothetical protein
MQQVPPTVLHIYYIGYYTFSTDCFRGLPALVRFGTDIYSQKKKSG